MSGVLQSSGITFGNPFLNLVQMHRQVFQKQMGDFLKQFLLPGDNVKGLGQIENIFDRRRFFFCQRQRRFFFFFP